MRKNVECMCDKYSHENQKFPSNFRFVLKSTKMAPNLERMYECGDLLASIKDKSHGQVLINNRGGIY